MQQTLEQFNQARAARLFRAYAPTDQVQFRALPRTKIRPAAYTAEQLQQEVAPAGNCPFGAITEEKDHRCRDYFGLQGAQTSFKIHRRPSCLSRFDSSNPGEVRHQRHEDIAAAAPK
jgi:hypothetical protein